MDIVDILSEAVDTADVAQPIGEVVQNLMESTPVSDYCAEKTLQFAGSGHEWVEVAKSGYVYERIDGVYTGQYRKL